MDGNTWTRSARSVAAMAANPSDALRWLRDRIERCTPISAGLPWIAWSCIRFLVQRVPPGARVFEWGAGGSTIFFAALGCSVVSVESSVRWAEDVTAALKRHGLDRRVSLDRVPA